MIEKINFYCTDNSISRSYMLANITLIFKRQNSLFRFLALHGHIVSVPNSAEPA